MTTYRQAHAAHQDALQRRDTRAQHQTAADLGKAMTERLRLEYRTARRQRLMERLRHMKIWPSWVCR